MFNRVVLMKYESRLSRGLSHASVAIVTIAYLLTGTVSLLAQTYSTTHDIADGGGDIYKNMIADHDTVFAISAHGCDGECMSVVKISSNGVILKKRTFSWMDEGDKDMIYQDGEKIIVCGSRGYGSEALLDVLVLDHNLDSLDHASFGPPDSVVVIAARSITAYEQYYVVVGFGVTQQGEVRWVYDDVHNPYGKKTLRHLGQAVNGDILGCGEIAWPWDPEDGEERYYGGFVFRMDSKTGEMLWERPIIGYDRFGNFAGKTFSDIEELPNGDLLMCGGWRIYDSNDLISYDSWLVRTDSAYFGHHCATHFAPYCASHIGGHCAALT